MSVARFGIGHADDASLGRAAGDAERAVVELFDVLASDLSKQSNRLDDLVG